MFEILTPYLGRADELEWFGLIAPLLMATLIIALCLGFVSKIGLTIIKNSTQAIALINDLKPRKKNLKELAQAEEQADTELTKLATDYGADRAYIALFHNGVHSLGNVDLLNITVKAEGSSGKFPRVMSAIRNLPFATYGKWRYKLINLKSIEALDSKSVAQDEAPEAFFMLERFSVKSLYAYPLVTPSGNVDGALFVEYCQSQRELGKNENDLIGARGQAIYTKLHEANNV